MAFKTKIPDSKFNRPNKGISFENSVYVNTRLRDWEKIKTEDVEYGFVLWTNPCGIGRSTRNSQRYESGKSFLFILSAIVKNH